MSRQGGHHKKSMTRSSALKGRPSPRKGTSQQTRQSSAKPVPMLVTEKDERPSLPRDRIFISGLPMFVALRYVKLSDLKTVHCFQCGASLGIRHATELKALGHPHRDGRPIDYVGERCCLPKFSDFCEDAPNAKRGAYQ